MCILCDTQSLRLLIAPLPSLSPGQLADAIRAAREAATQMVIRHVEAKVEQGDSAPELDADGYGELIVDRAQTDGVITPPELRVWRRAFADGTALRDDPRVQAFLSSCAEGVAEHQAMVTERSELLARYLEIRSHEVRVDSVGPDGEVWFDVRGDTFALLTEAESMELVVRQITDTLPHRAPDELLRYTTLPDGAVDVLADIQLRPDEEAADILAQMVDVAAMAEDAVRAGGYAPLLTEEAGVDVEETRFGEMLVFRTRAGGTPE